MKPQHQLLIVDDDTEITSLLGDYLARFNFIAHAAGDGSQMWAQLERHPIDLVAHSCCLFCLCCYLSFNLWHMMVKASFTSSPGGRSKGSVWV